MALWYHRKTHGGSTKFPWEKYLDDPTKKAYASKMSVVIRHNSAGFERCKTLEDFFGGWICSSTPTAPPLPPQKKKEWYGIVLLGQKMLSVTVMPGTF